MIALTERAIIRWQQEFGLSQAKAAHELRAFCDSREPRRHRPPWVLPTLPDAGTLFGETWQPVPTRPGWERAAQVAVPLQQAGGRLETITVAVRVHPRGHLRQTNERNA